MENVVGKKCKENLRIIVGRDCRYKPRIQHAMMHTHTHLGPYSAQEVLLFLVIKHI